MVSTIEKAHQALRPFGVDERGWLILHVPPAWDEKELCELVRNSEISNNPGTIQGFQLSRAAQICSKYSLMRVLP